MTITDAWRAFARANPITSTLLLVGLAFNTLVALALLVVGRPGDALDPASMAMLLLWIAALECQVAELRARR